MSDLQLNPFICEWWITTCYHHYLIILLCHSYIFLGRNLAGYMFLWLTDKPLTPVTYDNSPLSFCLQTPCPIHDVDTLVLETLTSTVTRSNQRPPEVTFSSLSVLFTSLSAVRLHPPQPPPPACHLRHKKARGVTHPEVSDDEGQHVAPLPIVLSSCQAPGSR